MRFFLAIAFLVLWTSAAAAAEVRVLMWSEYIDPEIPKQFEKETGIAVKIDVYEETEAMMAKLQAGGGSATYDVVVASDHSIPVLAKLQLIGKLDVAKIPNAANLDPRFVNPPYDPKGQYSLPYAWGTMGFLYNKKKLPGEATWAWAFDPARQPAKLVLLDSMRDLLGAALKTGGASVNTHDKEQLRVASQLLIAGKNSPKCLGFDGSPAGAKKVAAGQADLAIVYNGDALTALKDAQGKDLEYAVPKEGSIIWVDTMVVPAKAPNAEGAYKFINYLLDAKTGAQLANFINYASPNARAMDRINRYSKNDPRIYPTADQLKKLEYLEDVGQDTVLYDEFWTAIKSR